MDPLHRLVGIARRRMAWNRLLATVPWCCAAGLLAASVLIAVDKCAGWSVGATTWLAAGLCGGFVSASIWTWWTRPDALDAAIEVDLRFELRERISSALALDEAESATPAGRALTNDALRQAQRLAVAERFSVLPGRRSLAPLLIAGVVAVVAVMIEPASTNNTAAALIQSQQERQQVQSAAEALRRRLAERRAEAKKLGVKLEDGAELFDKLEKGAKELEKSEAADRKQALVKLNDLASEIQQRRKELGGNALREQLKQLGAPRPGAGDKLADAMQKGDFEQALNQLEKLREQLANEKLDDKGRKELAEQLQRMEQKLAEAAAAANEAAERLKQDIADARASGQAEKASALEEQLARLGQNAPQDERLKQLSKKMGECSECLRQGDSKNAQAALDSLEQSLKQMASQAQQDELLDNALEAIADARNAMGCRNCDGQGCEACRGRQPALGQKPGGEPGQRAGVGGSRPGSARGGPGIPSDNELQTELYDTRVGQKVGRGAGVITDFADGPNAPGQVRQAIQAETEAVSGGQADPLTDQPLSRSQREHAREYFEGLRKGQ